ncbi:MAG: hypothetical protein QNK38_06970, partial [Nitrospirota bacterium]|nr:hypothetical protein [Nitrospirota bacterium]MDX2420843.1 hypothetical protein [Nitrospirota bacterium]
MKPPHSFIRNQKGLSLWRWVGFLAVIVTLGVGAYWWLMVRPPELMHPPQTSTSSPIPAQNKGVMVSPEKQRMIGVKTEPATIRDLTH